jgi:hypothetical protein
VAVSLVTCFEIPLFKASNPPEILRSQCRPSVGLIHHLLHLSATKENTIVKIKIFHVRRYIGLLNTISSSQKYYLFKYKATNCFGA